MIVYFVRHGESEANKAGVIQGQKDFPLSIEGTKQAELVGEFFSSKQIDVLYTSDLTRAYETALAIAKHHPIEVIVWDKVKEIGLGPLEGKKRQEVELQYPKINESRSLLTTGIAGTETIKEITERCRYVLEQLIIAHQNKTVAIVSHGGFISIFLMYLMYRENWHDNHRPFIIGNTGVTKIEFLSNGNPIFYYINRDAHLYLKEIQSENVIY